MEVGTHVGRLLMASHCWPCNYLPSFFCPCLQPSAPTLAQPPTLAATQPAAIPATIPPTSPTSQARSVAGDPVPRGGHLCRTALRIGDGAKTEHLKMISSDYTILTH